MSYCDWNRASEAAHRYHDEEWGLPVHDDCRQFESLSLEVLQCGLNWNLIIQKRDIFRRCFDVFDYEKVARYGEHDVVRILSTPGMIRSRRKVEAIIQNAQRFCEIRTEFGTFCRYLWRYTDGRTILYEGHGEGRIPSTNGLSRRISKDLRKRGFQYLGPVVVYSHLQAAGLINDHGRDCPRYAVVNSAAAVVHCCRDEESGVFDYSMPR